MTRWISGIVMAVVVALLLIFARPVFLQAFVVVLAALGFKEYANLTQKGVHPAVGWIGTALCTLITAGLIFAAETPVHVTAYFTFALIATFLIHFRGNRDMAARVQKMALFFFGLVYLGLLFSFWGLICGLEQWQFWVFLMLACTFMSDTGAYIVGHLIGRHKLAPKLSPGKTLEGFLGGWAAALIAAFIIRAIFRPDYPVGHLLAVASCIAVIGPLGDLSESLLKRGVNAKDSGNLIPGHGGLLDRVDALLFVGPVVYFFAKHFDALV